jgi:L-ribulose-5-phosphate 4-epimerase
MCEDNAKSAWIAQSLGTPIAIPQEAVDSLFNRYQNVYGK